ncbi:glycosyltransferase family 4 protein [Bacillus sp. CMF12]|uniref:glycosyltransferase family 4 protein n=1 Tax=Bacillus sp. CMF12 TaxID=2884834 RepID=UPI00207AB993|nr:glycosyltransferase family 4 protein [Bacillus sp. CMF12]USK49614.1 glycosyltransferase family 4 protein [Bacillus sp. CMF12]
MNIWIFNHYATAPNHVGGTRHFDVAKNLCNKGHEVTIFASSFNHFSKKEMIFDETKKNYQIEMIDGVRFIWINTPSYSSFLGRVKNILSYTLKSYHRAKQEIENPDVVIGSSVHPLAAIIGYLISKKTNSKFYFEERDLWPQTFVDFGKLSKRNPLVIILYKLESLLYHKANRIIVLFEKAKDYVVSRGINEEKVIYLPNGVDTLNYEQLKKSQNVDKIFAELDGKFVVVYTGSHGIANHLKPVVELFSRLRSNPHLHLLMVGDGPYKKELMKMAKIEELQNITFLDPIPKSEIPYLLSKANMSIISIMDSPLYKWGFSMNKIYDYMAAGLPILMITNPITAGSLKEIDGIYANENLEEFERVISNYYTNPAKLKTDSQLLKKYAKDRYSWRVLSNKLNSYLCKDTKDDIE